MWVLGSGVSVGGEMCLVFRFEIFVLMKWDLGM
jgi:hypothetical protein